MTTSLPQSEAFPQRVLVVEDEPNQRSMLHRAITEAGFECQVTASAEQALPELERQPYAIVLLDLNLPGRGGLEFAQDVHQRRPRIRCIVLTGYGSLDAAQQAIRLDVVDFLTKPCSLGELEAALGRAWRKFLQGTPGSRRPVFAQADDAEPDIQTATGKPSSLDEVERQMIFAALDRHQGNRTAAARELGISVRTLYYRLSRYENEDRGSS